MNDHRASEAAALRRLFDVSGFKKAEFAAEHNVPGGASMVSQHLSGTRPISRAAAVAYARGFGVPLSEISPRLAGDVLDSVTVMEPQLPAGHQMRTISPRVDAGARASSEAGYVTGGINDERAELLRDIFDWLPKLAARDLIKIHRAAWIAVESARQPMPERDPHQQPSSEGILGLGPRR